jgi:formate dehydrogenase subunit gamma
MASDTGFVVRYNLRERVNHWITGLTYLYLMLTGLALFTPHLYWIAAVLGGGSTVRFWHPWAGLLFTLAMLWMHGMWRSDMRQSPGDREWNENLKKYVENRDSELPPVDRFNPGQKQFYWVMFLGMLLLLVSGVLMWFPESIPLWLRPLAIMLHEIAALITIAGFIVHVYMGVFVMPRGLHAIVHGDVPRWWAREHHRLWYNRIVGPARD